MLQNLIFSIYYPVFERQYTLPESKKITNYEPQNMDYKLIAIIIVSIVVVTLVLILINKFKKKQP